MLRVVAFNKAILAGAAGALVWEIALRLLSLAGFPIYDLVRELGRLAFPSGGPLFWWPAGFAAHAVTGAGWAVFYAYFFWARYRWPPALQGLAFAGVPALLAIFVVLPQLQLMHLPEQAVRLDWRHYLVGLEQTRFVSLIIGHALFGLTVGAIYTRPVGYSAFHAIKRPRSAKVKRRGHYRKAPPSSFMFATGIECSYPTTGHGRWRRDQLDATRHYQNWREDFELAREVGITHIRYGPPLHLIFTGPGQYDWSWCDEPLRELIELGPEPIVDLCHFGVPTWLGNFQNPDIAPALAEYARAFAQRYPEVRFYTPINEMYVCARMSALGGVWNEQLCDEGAFVRAVLNLANACVAMTDSIGTVTADAVFINSESSEFCQACCPDPKVQAIADFENERRFLAADLIYAHDVSHGMRDYLRGHGVDDQTYAKFMAREVPRRTVIGIDYYEWNEKLIDQQGRALSLGELFGWYVIAHQYWARYQRPLMHTETNRTDAAEAPRWLWRQWHNVQLLRTARVPIIGFTWYSLTDQVDWSHAIDQPLGIIFPVGLFDLNRDPRAVGLSYKHLIDAYCHLPEYRESESVMEILG